MIRVLKVAQFPFIMLRLRSFGPSLCLPLKMLMMKLVLPWTLGPISFQGFDWPWLPSTLWPFSPSAPFQCPCSLAIACLGPQQAPWQSFLPPNPSSHLVGKASNRSNTDKVLPIGVGSDWITILPNLGQKSNTNVKPLTRLCKDSNSSNMLITAIENQQPDPCLRILVVCRQRPRIKGHGGRISRLAEAASPPAWPLSAWAAHLKQVDGDYMRGNPFFTYTCWPWLSNIIHTFVKHTVGTLTRKIRWKCPHDCVERIQQNRIQQNHWLPFLLTSMFLLLNYDVVSKTIRLYGFTSHWLTTICHAGYPRESNMAREHHSLVTSHCHDWLPKGIPSMACTVRCIISYIAYMCHRFTYLFIYLLSFHWIIYIFIHLFIIFCVY